MTTRRLETRLKEHKRDDNSALKRHSLLMAHEINYKDTKIMASDSNKFRLQIKETLKIIEHSAFKSLNGNIGSLNLKLW
jgi:hypothetical protein